MLGYSFRLFCISLAELAVRLEPTKRNIVSLVGRFYDPIGVLSPVVVSFKILIQEICESHTSLLKNPKQRSGMNLSLG